MMLIPERLVASMRILSANFDDGKTNWAIAGSVALALHGLPVNPKDLEAVTDALNIEFMDRVLEKKRVFAPGLHMGEPLMRLTVGQYSLTPEPDFAHSLRYEPTILKLMSGLEYREQGGQWHKAPDFMEHLERIRFQDMSFPVVSLQWLLEYYIHLERPGRVNLIRSKLNA